MSASDIFYYILNDYADNFIFVTLTLALTVAGIVAVDTICRNMNLQKPIDFGEVRDDALCGLITGALVAISWPISIPAILICGIYQVKIYSDTHK